MATLSPLFSDLRGVTVRNTFLEFADNDGGDDDILPEQGFMRQASEPTKPFNRQVSEQTTAGSGVTFSEETSLDAEEHSIQQFAYMPAPPGAFTNAGAMQQQLDMVTAAMQQVPASGAVARFCPNCGSEAECQHRFCPYCCYQLHPFPGAALAVPEQTALAPVKTFAGSTSGPAGGMPDLLNQLGRFRYVEATSTLVDFARVLCVNRAHAGN